MTDDRSISTSIFAASKFFSASLANNGNVWLATPRILSVLHYLSHGVKKTTVIHVICRRVDIFNLALGPLPHSALKLVRTNNRVKNVLLHAYEKYITL